MIDRSVVGSGPEPVTVTVERGRLQFFGRVLGAADGVFVDPAAARAAGHPDLPVPPTFLFGLDLEAAPDLLNAIGVDLSRVLHVEQGFTYHRTVHAGDRLTFAPVITDVYSRQGGALEFVVRDTSVTDAAGEPVAELHQVIAVRRPVPDKESA
ncbi:MaoC family dehydratase N-terminal domain-containing protein [Streptomyces sp. NBC_00378]|uniref:MaoC family dehydratase N-terminal domain-containing protein n=1 Tax=unclassified Streptomyces TaxID=2593676 RepID=UPI002255B3B3|nr:MULTISPECIES: MaoC family dehydratase N-terminal domain-containing protein [unclassified Streptomyces]MCX5108452.1 MaoC family dehydratase N-terminal domain-containing protein [Streptomyces sp. NBC_00378]